MINSNIKKSESGFAALVAVVIIGAVSLLIAKNISILSWDELETSYTLDKGEEALAIAEGCAEETIRRFELSSDYSASDLSLELGNGECLINTSADGDNRVITVTGRVIDFYRKISVNISISSSSAPVLNSWEEDD